MQWTKPDFQEITLGMEVSAYANTDSDIRQPEEARQRTETEVVSPAVPAQA